MSYMSRYYGLIQESKEFFRRSDKATRLHIRKFVKLCRKCRNQRDITRLWEVVDNFPVGSESVQYWGIMRIIHPAAFKRISEENATKKQREHGNPQAAIKRGGG